MASAGMFKVQGATMRVTERGHEETVVGQVTGLTGSAQARLYSALNTPGVPRRGDYHPVVWGMRCDEVVADPEKDSASIVRITAVYRNGEHVYLEEEDVASETAIPTLEVGTTLQPTTTELDIHGEQIHTRHQVMENNEPVLKYQMGSVQHFRAFTTVRYTRREPNSPREKSIAFVNTINKTPVFDDPPRFWLCTRIGGVRSDRGGYDVTYEFQRNPGQKIGGRQTGWDAVVIQTDEETGRPVESAVVGFGLTIWQVYAETEFRQMLLT